MTASEARGKMIWGRLPNNIKDRIMFVINNYEYYTEPYKVELYKFAYPDVFRDIDGVIYNLGCLGYNVEYVNNIDSGLDSKLIISW